MNWTDTADGKHRHCARHDETFARGSVCMGCVSDPAEAPGVEREDGAIDLELLKEARAYQGMATFLHRVGREMIEEAEGGGEGAGKRDLHAAAKLIAEGTKLARFSFEIRDRVAGRDHDRALVAHEREMAGKRQAH